MKRSFLPFAALVQASLLCGAAAAQGIDARVLPKGLVAVRVAGEYTHYDSRFGGAPLGGPLGSRFETEFSATLFPTLAPLEEGLARFISTVAPDTGGGAYTVSQADVFPGTARINLAADIRRIPVTLEAGVTRRLTASLTVPFEHYNTDVAGFGLFGGAIGRNPDAARNSAILRRIDPAFAGLGGSFFLPTQKSAAGRELRSRVRAALGTADSVQILLPELPLNLVDLQGLLAGANRESLRFTRSTRPLALGDVELSARYQLINTVADTAGASGEGRRLVVHAGVTFPTARVTRPDSLLDIGSPSGHAGLEAGVIGDLLLRNRLWVTAHAQSALFLPRNVLRHTLAVGDASFALAPARTLKRTPGMRLTVGVTPRYRLTQEFSLAGRYVFSSLGETTYDGLEGGAAPLAGLESTAARTAHSIGAGMAYSTLSAFQAGRTRIPLEVALLVENAIAGGGGGDDAGVVRMSGRLFYPAWGRRRDPAASPPPPPTEPR